jgi:hypothetical protein
VDQAHGSDLIDETAPSPSKTAQDFPEVRTLC